MDCQDSETRGPGRDGEDGEKKSNSYRGRHEGRGHTDVRGTRREDDQVHTQSRS